MLMIDLYCPVKTRVTAENDEAYIGRGLCMLRYDKKTLIVIFVILIVISIFNLFYMTRLYISDVDPSTYIVVPLMMLPLLALFVSKEDITPKVGRKDIAYGTVLFVLFVVINAYLRVSMSLSFLIYKIDLLLIPILLASYATLLFGLKNLRKFYPVFVYAIFASPILLIPIINMNSSFADANSVLVYSVVKFFINEARFIPPITIAANGNLLGIGETCVGIGVLIGIALFLSPVAYLYDGSFKKKFLWIFSSVLLVFMLNFLRMSGIAISWFVYGPDVATSIVHSFAGILLFYISIIVMMLLAGRFGLYARSEKRNVGKGKKILTGMTKLGIILAILFSVFYYLFTSYYSNVQYISPAIISNANKLDLSSINLQNSIGYNMKSDLVYSNYTSLSMSLYDNVSLGVVGVYATSSNMKRELLKNNDERWSFTFYGNDGKTAHVSYLVSNNTGLMLYDSQLPIIHDGKMYILNEYEVTNATATTPEVCRYNLFLTFAYNLFNIKFYNDTVRTEAVYGYCTLSRLID